MLELLLMVSTRRIRIRAGLVNPGAPLIGQQGQSSDLAASIRRQNYAVNALYFHARITTGNMNASHLDASCHASNSSGSPKKIGSARNERIPSPYSLAKRIGRL